MAYHESHERRCPTCNEFMSATAPRCLNCGEYVDDNDDDDEEEAGAPRVPIGLIVGAATILAGVGLAVYFIAR
jgi:hypothetical protein